MIIIGYQGIGKSSVAGIENGCIDLESSNFQINGKRSNDWYVSYCRIALALSQQGFVVLVSSHKEVREYLVRFVFENYIVCVYPETWLQTDWIARLENRYKLFPSDKNYRALMNAKDRFKDNIKELKSWGGFYYGITDMNYDLLNIISYLKSLR